ncbi:hypothetical protein BCV69DRAFT_280862 [Microstroma glucosiphilum]|uniref:Uncharacterized protein n=1 Tax=Pseudomicrostroma glucosiphilum TaxID=1684307 RepID=A0A316UH41_9BASI|nr:hypothetical protein BCV69DRAFT_280862 [Pseudomicrostroma glucosiphilum]PWN23253.1 hypothetical protein BCV69DRAFT_280862 [Pseudomicrostroma glucosiphilum]
MSTSSSELAAIEAQLALQRAALADKIFARFDQSSSSSSRKANGPTASGSASSPSASKKKQDSSGVGQARKGAADGAVGASAPFEHRPPTLGLGATAQMDKEGTHGKTLGNGSRHLSNEDARLRGRLTSKKEAAASSSANGAGKRKAGSEEDEEDEEDESKAGKLAKGKAAGKTKVDPFAAKPPKASKKLQKDAQAVQETSETKSSASPTLPVQAAASALSNGRLHTPPSGEESQLSKNQRKKLNKKRRLEQEVQAAEGGRAASPTLSVTSSAKKMPAKPTSTVKFAARSESPSAPADASDMEDAPQQAASTLEAGSAYRPSGTLPSSSAQPASTLSVHQKALHSKIQGSHFRQLNESLYTSESSDSFRLAQEDPSRMQAYHEGFREQAKKWPQKPFEKIGDVIVGDMIASWEQMLSNGSGKGAATGKGVKGSKQADASRLIPVGAVVADLGAGEGPLTKYLSAHPKLTASKGGLAPSLQPRVLAYDLLDTADGIVRGVDCAQVGGVPLPGRQGGGIRERISRLEQRGSQTALSKDRGAVDVVVFCLSLMGTDWVGMILEARRILKNGGQILIAEVSSRFTDPSTQQFTKLVERLGFKLMAKEAEKEDGKKDKENSHFVLLRYAKLTDEEVLASTGKGKKGRGNDNGQANGASSEASEDSEGEALIQEARELDEKEQNRLRLEGQAVLKPCLYKRR